MPYSYFVPLEFQDSVQPGVRVTVNFGKGKLSRQGFVLRVEESDCIEGLKPILSVLDDNPVLSEEQCSLCFWMSERYFCTLFEAAKAMLPTGLCYRFDGDTPKRRTGDASVKTATLAVTDTELESVIESLSPKQRAVMEVLRDVGQAAVKELCYFTGCTTAVVQALEKKGLVELTEEEFFRRPHEVYSQGERTEINLTDEQRVAYEKFSALMRDENPAAGLLFGVTGSGKTKVYMRLIDDCLDMGRGCVLMVPEISLTPQALSIFYGRYGNRVAVIHSGLAMGERLDEWKRIKKGEADLVIGTRSAVFAPLDNPGLFIIDEEQEHTYKSEMSPRYDAKDVAKRRCVSYGGLCLLVSATPSVETYTAALNGRLSLARLTKRYGSAVLPEVVTVDMSQKRSLISNALSREMADALRENLEKGEQSLLLLNRRGFNTFVTCTECKHVLTCPNCSISMTYHSANNRLLCHYCGYSMPVPDRCPECGEKNIRYSGFGTQRIEEELKVLFPEARVLRMDADTTMAKFAHEKKLKQFSDGEYDILLGTQMVAKGLDFPNVTFVGVVSADSQLNDSDYRSLERTFDLLMQVVGRSGRGTHKGTAMIQTLAPENDIIRLSAAQDYEAYYNIEMALRQMMTYPPYCDICLVNFTGENEARTLEAAKSFFDGIVSKNENEYKNQKLIILGPTPAKVFRVSNKYRYRLIIKCKNSAEFRRMIRENLVEFMKNAKYNKILVHADINPESMI